MALRPKDSNSGEGFSVMRQLAKPSLIFKYLFGAEGRASKFHLSSYFFRERLPNLLILLGLAGGGNRLGKEKFSACRGEWWWKGLLGGGRHAFIFNVQEERENYIKNYIDVPLLPVMCR